MSSAEGPAAAAVASQQQPDARPPAPSAPREDRISLSHGNRLAKLASGAATTFLFGGVASILLSLFPLRLSDSQWQQGALANLVSNGSWILIGLVLLHLACMLQPRNGPLNRRLLLWRRLAALAAGGYLLMSPLQVAVSWIGLDASQNSRERVITKSETQLKAYRDALLGSANLTDLKDRLGAIPGAPNLPEQASLVPYTVVRERLLQQLEQAEARFRQKVQAIKPGHNTPELWRQTARGSLASLLLALGFASGAEGLFGQASLLESLAFVVSKARAKPARGRSLVKGFRNFGSWLQHLLKLPKRKAIRPISSRGRKDRRRPLRLKIPRQWQFWRKKKRSSRHRIRLRR